MQTIFKHFKHTLLQAKLVLPNEVLENKQTQFGQSLCLLLTRFYKQMVKFVKAVFTFNKIL